MDFGGKRLFAFHLIIEIKDTYHGRTQNLDFLHRLRVLKEQELLRKKWPTMKKMLTAHIQRDIKINTSSLNLYHKSNLTTLSPSSQDIELPSSNQLFNNQLLFSQPPPPPKMQTQALMGRGGYNRTSPILGRGGYNRDIKTSGISRPSNPSSLVVRSARVAADDGRGGYN
ncbi:unnamed protein product [Aureobasidium mustum]|uniref:Uncharacterized protein n=1 Tax=Aureobasidium mustum TaxID=2773714 RepID=A0A9N8JSZ2_9PEZI|nr:unnamed protein product [Aureobasidium mustum]